jgi:hypothetical protein
MADDSLKFHGSIYAGQRSFGMLGRRDGLMDYIGCGRM